MGSEKWCRGTELNCRHQPFQGEPWDSLPGVKPPTTPLLNGFYIIDSQWRLHVVLPVRHFPGGLLRIRHPPGLEQLVLNPFRHVRERFVPTTRKDLAGGSL